MQNVVSDWKLESGNFTLNVTVPVNTTAHIVLLYTADARLDDQSAQPEPDGSYLLESGSLVFSAAVN